MGLVISLTIFSFISFIINMHYSGKLIAYSMGEQIKDVVHLLAIGIFIFMVLQSIKQYFQLYLPPDFLVVFGFGVSFALLYFSIVMVADKELLRTLKNIYKGQ